MATNRAPSTQDASKAQRTPRVSLAWTVVIIAAAAAAFAVLLQLPGFDPISPRRGTAASESPLP